jgi:DMSO/TMAO reductase YedYZ molybdopterin-dependent catalytic subunit
MTRTIPMSLVESGEVLVAYGQNGEMLRPENGYPLRLVVPGVQGVSWVKYLRRIEVGDSPGHQGRGHPLHRPDARWPASPVHQHPGVQERGHHALGRPGAAGQGLLQHHRPGLVGPRQGQKGRRVGRRRAQLAPGAAGDAGAVQVPDPLQHRLGLGRQAALIQSRATDDTGYVQPTYQQLRAVRGTRSIYHNNAIQSWLVQESGEVKNVQFRMGASAGGARARRWRGAASRPVGPSYPGRRPRRHPQGSRGLGHRRAPRLQGPACKGSGRLPRARTSGKPSAPLPRRVRRVQRGVHARWSAAPRRTTSRPGAWRACLARTTPAAPR